MKLKLQYVAAFLICLYLLILIKTAWLCDDAFITFRTVDNFINGFGLRWNIDERVQAFTHPLWLFVVSFFYFLTHEIYYTTIIVSVLISLTAILLITNKISVDPLNSIFILLVLISSKAYIDYSTSGLENPLTHLLLAVFAIVYMDEIYSLKKLFQLSLIASLAAVNRMDTVLILIPALLFYAYKTQKIKSIFILGLGFFPFVLWEVFSLLYYGFPFPNTAYAKLNTGISNTELALQGFKYYINSLKFDPVTLTAILGCCIVSFFSRNKKLIPLALGILLYLVYVIKIGGDFMSGRFFTAALLISMVVFAHLKIKSFILVAVLSALALILGFIAPYPNFLSDVNYGINRTAFQNIGDDGIADERAVYFSSTGLLRRIKGTSKTYEHPWETLGRQAKQNGYKLVTRETIGFFGFYAGPNVHVLDTYALSEPLLARLHAVKPWRIGHFERKIPDGYSESLLYGKNLIHDKNLAKFYDKIHLINSGEIFEQSRIKEIVNMNRGRYSYLIDEYIKSEIKKNIK